MGGQYAIHGTNMPGSVGGFVSYGCIRMYNADIVDLYGRVGVGTRVLVIADAEFDQLELEYQPCEANVDDGDQDRRGDDAGPRKRLPMKPAQTGENLDESGSE